jgi:hypothetical protein
MLIGVTRSWFAKWVPDIGEGADEQNSRAPYVVLPREPHGSNDEAGFPVPMLKAISHALFLGSVRNKCSNAVRNQRIYQMADSARKHIGPMARNDFRSLDTSQTFPQ